AAWGAAWVWGKPGKPWGAAWAGGAMFGMKPWPMAGGPAWAGGAPNPWKPWGAAGADWTWDGRAPSGSGRRMGRPSSRVGVHLNWAKGSLPGVFAGFIHTWAWRMCPWRGFSGRIAVRTTSGVICWSTTEESVGFNPRAAAKKALTSPRA